MSVLLLFVSGVLHIILPHTEINKVIYARIIGGLGYGTILPTFIIYSGEITYHKYRGYTTASSSSSIAFGICIYSFINYYVSNASTSFMYLGILTCLDAILAVIFMIFFTYESPLYLIANGRDLEAKGIIKVLQKNWTNNSNAIRTNETINLTINNTESQYQYNTNTNNDDIFDVQLQQEFQDYQSMVVLNKSWSFSQMFSMKNIKLLVMIVLFKLALVLVFNYTINLIFASVFQITIEELQWLIIIIHFARAIASIVPTLTIDCIGRRKTFIYSGMFSAIIVLFIGISLIVLKGQEVNKLLYWIPHSLFILLNIVSALGLLCIGDVYAAEILPISTKSMTIAICYSLEYLFQILLIFPPYFDNFTNYSVFIYVFIFVTSFLLAIITLGLGLTMAETSKLKLKDCINLM